MMRTLRIYSSILLLGIGGAQDNTSQTNQSVEVNGPRDYSGSIALRSRMQFSEE